MHNILPGLKESHCWKKYWKLTENEKSTKKRRKISANSSLHAVFFRQYLGTSSIFSPISRNLFNIFENLILRQVTVLFVNKMITTKYIFVKIHFSKFFFVNFRYEFLILKKIYFELLKSNVKGKLKLVLITIPLRNFKIITNFCSQYWL